MKTLYQLLYQSQYSKVWPGLNHEQIFSNCESLKYIMKLATDTAFDTGRWDIQEVFRDKGHCLVTDRTELNRRYFERYEKERGDYTLQIGPLVTKMKAQLKGAYPGIELKHLERVRSQMVGAEADLFDCNRAVREGMGRLRSLHLLEYRITGRKDYSLEGAIEEVIETCSFLTFHSVYEEKILFVTNGSIVLTEKNPAAGLDISVDLGKFRIAIDPAEMILYVYRHENNIREGTYHPHVASDGVPCYGDATPDLEKALIAGDLAQAIHILWSVLNHYNPGNPFVALAKLQQVLEMNLQKQLDPPPPPQIPEGALNPNWQRVGRAVAAPWDYSDQIIRPRIQTQQAQELVVEYRDVHFGQLMASPHPLGGGTYRVPELQEINRGVGPGAGPQEGPPPWEERANYDPAFDQAAAAAINQLNRNERRG